MEEKLKLVKELGKTKLKLKEKKFEDLSLEDIFNPVGTRILVKQTIALMSGMIIIPQNGTCGEKDEGVIVALGSEATKLELGDYVIHGKYAGLPFRYKGTQYQLMEQGDVLATILSPKKWKESKGIKEQLDMKDRLYKEVG